MAIDLMDDYYLNLLHWGRNNCVAIALKQSVYMWNATDRTVQQLLTLEGEDDYVTSVQWSADNENTIAVGTSNNSIQIWDATQEKMIREIYGHNARVSSLAWNGSIVSSGSRDTTIRNNDVRIQRSLQSLYVGHTQEVCGLAWSHDGQTLASGGNDNLLCLWDNTFSENSNAPSSFAATSPESNRYSPRYKLEQHTAAVKAVSWCPFQRHVLASGGGTVDRHLRIWNSSNGTILKSVDTGSQVSVCHMTLLLIRVLFVEILTYSMFLS